MIATKCVDIRLHINRAKHLSIFKTPIDFEIFYSGNPDSLFNSNQAKHDVTIELSSVRILLSEERLHMLSQSSYSGWSKHWQAEALDTKKDDAVPPRLEVLSNLFPLNIDLSVCRISVSLLSVNDLKSITPVDVKIISVKESMAGFLQVAAGFNLSYPNDEALSSAMQICIDRLVGLGFSIDDAWEATNSVLLNFLESMADVKQEVEAESDAQSVDDSIAIDEEFVFLRIQKSVQQVAILFAPALDVEYSSRDLYDEDAVLDFADGVTLKFVKLYYDSHACLSVPTLFLSNKSGLHLIRVSPQESDSDEYSPVDHGSDFSNQANESFVVDSTSLHQPPNGLIFRLFSLDENFLFGTGGLPLVIVGTDVALDARERRSQETLIDVEMGDIEFLFAHTIGLDLLNSVTRTCSPLKRQGNPLPVNEVSLSRPSSISSRVTFSGTISSSSILCLSDDLKPFTRFFASDILARADLSLHQVEHLQRDRERMHGSFASCQSVGLLNLTPEGELFPTLVSSMNDTDNKCLQIRVNTDGDIDIVFEGFRIFFLNQFVNELLQFFINGDYGFGLLLKSFTKHRDSKGKLDSSRRCILSFRGTSILLPRSSLSYDMLCLEVDKLSLTSSKAATTFAVPSSSERLFVERENTCSEASLGETSEKPIPRIRILLEGLRILSSLHDTGMIQDIIHHSPSFRFYFTIDGHAKAGKLVYCPIIHSGIDLEDDPSVNMAMAQRRWKELTIESTFLEIFVDRVPHVRILICDPVDCDTRSGLQLDILLSQFCMMLSVFFSNMQELPITFPLSVMQLRDGASSNSMPLVPEYGSEEFRSFLSELVGLTTEIAVVVDVISFRSGFDRDIEENSPKKISIYLRNAVVHVINDLSGVCRVSSGCCSVRLIDESLPFSSVLEVGNESACAESWADMCFGLQRNLQALPRILPQAFQFSAFILPGCVLYNIGMNQPSITLSNLSPVFQFLDFISSYFSDPQFGNPSFETSERVAAIKQELMHTEPSSAKMKKHSASSVEFRLWLARPALSIPCDPDDMNCPAVCLKSTGGLWYKLSIQDKILSSHECAADGMQLVLDNLDSIRHSTDDVYKARNLVENLSLGIRLDFNSELSHNDVNVQIPFIDHGACDLTSPRICVSPTVLSSPSICKPFEQPDRFLGAEVCEFTLVIDVLPLTLSTLLTFFSVASDPPAIPDTAPPDMLATSSTSVKRDSTFSIVARVADVRMFLLDPILGAHLPVAMASVSTVSVTLSQFATDESYEAGLSCESPSDLQAIVAGHFWIDSFKLGQTRSWEPLIERYKFNGMHERSGLRGNGLLLNSNSSFHVNVSSALLVVLDDIINALNGLITETFESSTTAKSTASQANATTLAILHDTFNGNHMVHDLPVPLLSNARAAFSLRNKTGQCVRIFRPPENVTTSSQSSPGVLTYLNHSETTKLSYVPSVSRVKNLQVTEVRFPGVTRTSHQDIEIIPEHTVDLQLPGFKWIKDIAVDTFGRSFASIVPKRSTVLQKVENDWRLDNVMNVLVEVSLHNGGRQVTVRSLITIVNTTRHMINLMFNTSPVCKPNQTLNNRSRDVALIPDAEIGQGESFQVPALLFESALRSTGNHLGSMWLKPSVDVSNRHAMQCFANDADDLVVDFSSKPVQFSRLVGESAAFFDASTGHDLAPDQIVSGMQLSCPVVEQTGFRLAPFCYVLEVERSPIVQAMTKVKAGSKKARRTHCPVAYSLMIHAPYTISNFLSTAARFELLHAVNRTVLWFGDLKPGEEIPIHSVGLDIPLVLFLNLGFAKTPVGEGALVHHGSDQPRGVRGKMLRFSFIKFRHFF